MPDTLEDIDKCCRSGMKIWDEKKPVAADSDLGVKTLGELKRVVTENPGTFAEIFHCVNPGTSVAGESLRSSPRVSAFIATN